MKRVRFFQLEYRIEPANATNKVVTWKSENPEIATVDENGHVQVKDTGKVKIIVTTVDGGHSDSITVDTITTTILK